MEVDADSLYEAVALAVAEFRKDEMNTAGAGPMTEFTVAAYRKPLEHRMRLNQVTKWAEPTTKDGAGGDYEAGEGQALLGSR